MDPVPAPSRPSDPIVELARLSKRYGSLWAARDIDLLQGPGEILSLLGPNGAGKTTTIRMMTGILHASAGTARIGGLDCFRDRAEVMRRVGYLPDEPVFYDFLKGGEILEFVGEMHGLPRSESQRRARALVERLDYASALTDYAVNYSKGMRKKLALTCALLHEPAVLILDEPTNGLDPYATRTVHELLRERAREGTAVFFSTHLLDQAERLSDRVAILFEGRLAAVGPIEELRARMAPGGSLEEVFFAVTSEPAP